MRITIRGHHLPGRTFGEYRNVHVGLQVGSRPVELVPADAAGAEWQVQVEVIPHDEGPDFRGAAVQGRRGERFVYLTWGEVDGTGFAMFRRAKLMLADVPRRTGAAATGPCDLPDDVLAEVDLTDDTGGPRCARLREPAIRWTAAG